jgi:hypothetical protein
MTLRDVIARLHEFDDELTIYARRDPEWTESSRAIVAAEPEEGLEYVLQVRLAKEALSVWSKSRKNRLPSLRERYEAVLYCALNDAFIPVDLDQQS